MVQLHDFVRHLICLAHKLKPMPIYACVLGERGSPLSLWGVKECGGEKMSLVHHITSWLEKKFVMTSLCVVLMTWD